ncbi:uncharacterized protein LOC112888392 isoform X3 [Panicum hallii]|uniref:uncharacterized protein LOC112888392 isoform X3 n=1 Tax=Panicum hallii TaxID=206008 RepID=UPI000DF4DEB0|nr:uncharacterized protein LOC112888392 isoform X3 [Panicum hallii]
MFLMEYMDPHSLMKREHMQLSEFFSPVLQIFVMQSCCTGKESEGGDHKVALMQNKLKAKSFKWRSSNSDMNKVEAGGSDEVYNDTVLCSLSTASFSSLVSRKRVRNLGKVAEQCDAVDPPVPRKLRSAIKKRVDRFVSASSRHVKKRRHLSAISAQISFVDQKTRFNGNSLFTEEEEVIADVLLSLSQISSLSELTVDKATADSSNPNVASTSYSEGATRGVDEIVILPSPANDLASQATCIDKVVGHTNSVPHANPVPGAGDQSSNINSPSSENEQIQDLSLETVVNLPSPSKDSSNNSTLKQQKVRFDDSQSYAARKPEAPLWLVNSNKSDISPHEREKAKNSSAQEIVPMVQTPLPLTPDGCLIKPSSCKLTAHKNTTSEASKFTARVNQDKSYLQPSLVKNVGSTKAWKRSITHVYVSHVIQMHMNKEKASQNQAKPEETPLARPSRSPNGSAIPKNSPQDEKFYTVHFDVQVPVQPSAGMGDTSAGRQKIVGGNFMNLPTSTALPGTQHLQYLHPQIAPRGAMPYPFPHLPYSRGNLAPAAALQQMPQQYMGSMGYAPRPGLPASSSAMMKTLHQLIPTQQQQQQQQMWQYHVSQYQPRPDATPPPAAWHNMPSLRPTMAMLPPPAMPPQMELFCAPYQGGGGGRQPQQLRLI